MAVKPRNPYATKELSKKDRVRRLAAKEQGRKRYKTALPCPYGHYGERYTKGSMCCECVDKSTNNKQADRYNKRTRPALDTLYERLTGRSERARREARETLERLRDTHEYSRVRSYARKLLRKHDEEHSVPDSDS